jgi:hypothetical protein
MKLKAENKEKIMTGHNTKFHFWEKDVFWETGLLTFGEPLERGDENLFAPSPDRDAATRDSALVGISNLRQTDQRAKRSTKCKQVGYIQIQQYSVKRGFQRDCTRVS